MNNFSFEPLKLKLATNNIIIPMENGVADLTNAETSAKIMLAGKELFPNFDERIGGRNLISNIPNNWAKGYYHPTTGGPTGTGSNHNLLKERISCEPNSYYTMSSPKRMVALQYDEDDVYIPPMIDKGENKTLTFKTHSSARYLRFFILFAGEPNELNLISEYKLKIEKGTIPTDWTPAPEDILQLATLSSYNCSAAIVGDLIKITSHTPGTARGWVDVTVNYGNLSNTKRLNWSVEGVEPYKPTGTLLTMNNRGIKL